MRETLKVLGRSKAVDILFALRENDLKFSQIVQIAQNQTTASRRMDDFLEAKLVSREVLQDKKRRVKYSLTEKGNTVAEFLKELEESL